MANLDNIEPLALSAEEKIGLIKQIEAWQNAIGEAIPIVKNRFCLWYQLKKTPGFKEHLDAIFGRSLVEQNRSLDRVTREFGLLLQRLIKKNLYAIGWQNPGTTKIELILVSAKTYEQLRRKAATRGIGALFEIVALIVIGSIVAIGAITTFLGIEQATQKFKALNATMQAGIREKALAHIASVAATDPAAARRLTDAFTKAESAAAATTNKSFFEQLGESALSIGKGVALAVAALALLSFSKK